MNDPKPWLQDGAPDGWRALLDAARDDGPTQAQLARLRVKVLSGPGGGGGGPAGGGGGARGLWLGGAAVGVAVAVVAFQLGRAAQSPDVAVPPPPAPTLVVAPPAPPPSVEPPPAAPAQVAAPVAPKPPPRAPVKPVAALAPDVGPSELELLQQAMTALQAKDFSGGRALIDQHARRFPDSDLAQEREVLRIEASVGLGAHEEARRLAEAFNRQWPTSTHRLRVEALVK